MYWPTSREALPSPKTSDGKKLPNFVAAYSFNNAVVERYLGKERYSAKLKSRHGAGEGGAMPKKADDWSKNGDGCNGLMMGAPVANYTEGQEIEVVIPIQSQHGGEYEFRLCSKKWDDLGSDLDHLKCLDENLLYRQCVTGDGCDCKSDKCRSNPEHTDPEDPIYTKHKNSVPLVGSATMHGGYLLKMKLPEGVSCEHCTLQWYWFTAWSEEWWGCSDISVAPGPTKIVDPEPSTTPAPSPPATPAPSPDTGALEKRVASLEAQLKRLAPLQTEVKLLKAMITKLIGGGGRPSRRRQPSRRRMSRRRSAK